jgi:carboxyl-terminal processing protease
MERDAVLELLDGEAGTSVELIVRTPDQAPRSLELVRDEIAVPAVEVRRPEDEVAYLRISHFSPQVVDELDAALSDLASDPPTGLVVDLRDNPGGDLESLRSAAGRFVEGPVWIEVDRDGATQEQPADSDGAPSFDVPERVVVLVNAGTASAAEMLAASLRHSVGAVLVGDPTYGKGAIQIIHPLSDESVVRLTVAQWNTPDGEPVEGVGLTPDTLVDGAEEQLEAAISAALGAAADVRAAGG